MSSLQCQKKMKFRDTNIRESLEKILCRERLEALSLQLIENIIRPPYYYANMHREKMPGTKSIYSCRGVRRNKGWEPRTDNTKQKKGMFVENTR